MNPEIQFDSALVERYGVTGPRYTSYPTAVQFHEGFDAEAYRRHVLASNEELIPRPLSLYLHLPFCHSLCYYCGCMKKVTRHRGQTDVYLQYLHREIELQAALFDRDRPVDQLHLGGGTPTYHDDEDLRSLLDRLKRVFTLSTEPEREFSIEIDPRTVSGDRLANLAEMGFNRISLGVQDMDPAVQKAVNRIQDPEATLALVEQARELDYNSVSIDLIYGLPLQTVESFEITLDRVLGARPDRLSVYNYAHLPQLFRSQRMIRDEDVPSAQTRLQLMELTISKLTGAGYQYIGMDHFALPEDELSLAQKDGSLQRNFQGYSTRRDRDLVGLGVSAIGKIGDCYAQNIKDIQSWQTAVGEGQLPVWRGITLSADDRLRRGIIESIMCHGGIRYDRFESCFDIDFNDYFALELNRLDELQDDGLIEISEDGFEATPRGRLLLRSVAMAFDAYLKEPGRQPRFSRVI